MNSVEYPNATIVQIETVWGWLTDPIIIGFSEHLTIDSIYNPVFTIAHNEGILIEGSKFESFLPYECAFSTGEYTHKSIGLYLNEKQINCPFKNPNETIVIDGTDISKSAQTYDLSIGI